ncbi:MAG: hypothetical protein WCV84_05520 [Patescibacteria group bacterium]
MRRSSLILLTLLVCAIPLMGFGCKQNTYKQYQPGDQLPSWLQRNLAKPSSGAKKTTTDANTSGESSMARWNRGIRGYDNETVPQNIQYLRQVMKNFANVNSFRVTFTIPGKSGLVQGTAEFQRDQGLHGIFQVPNAQNTEMYLVKDLVYVRAGTSTWLNLTDSPEGQTAKEALASVFSSTNTDNRLYIDKKATVQTSEDPRGCKMHAITQHISGLGKQTIQLCIKNDLPMIISMILPEGPLEMSYTDFNQRMELNPPM